MSEFIIGVDLGGTQLRAARLDYRLEIVDRRETPTQAHEGPDAVIERMIALIRSVWPKADDTVIGIGVSSPGPLDPLTGVVLAPLNLPGWNAIPLAQRLREVFPVPVYVGNDANVAVLAEAARGAAQGCKHAIYITVSTGIGSGIMVDGRLLLGHSGIAGEAGYMMLIVDGKGDYLEHAAAGPALAKQAREQIEAGRESLVLTLAGGDISSIDSKIVGQAARAGDALALEIVHRAGYVLGLGMVSLLHLFNPEILMIGGGVTNLGDLLFEPMRTAMKEFAVHESYLDELRIERPMLGEDVSIVGAAALVRTQGGLLPFLKS